MSEIPEKSPDMAKLKDLEGKLEIYKRTLTEIYEQYDQKIEELSLVRRMGDALRSTHSLEALSKSLLETVAIETSVDRLTLMLTQERKGLDRLFIRAAYWADQEIFSFFETTRAVPWSLNLLGDLLPKGKLTEPIIIVRAEAKFDPLGREEDEDRALVFLPLTVRRRLLGLLVLSRHHNRPFSPEDERMLTIMADQAGSALSSVLLFDDLTRVNQRLVESESRARQVSGYLQNLLETANDAMLTLNQEGLITYANRKAAQWGWSREELLGREFRSLLAEPERLKGWPAGSPPPPDMVLEAVLVNASDERRDVILSTSKVAEGAGAGAEKSGGKNAFESYSAWMILANDMTERKYLERQLIHSEKLASIGLLAAGVAHEVGNPLSAISGYAQILASGVDNEGERKEYLDAIVNQTGRIQKILKELLDYSRPSKGLVELLDLSEAIPRTIGMIRAQRIFRGVELKLELNERNGPYLVSMDPDHLAQIVIIIAMNAAQAMRGEGAFTIALSREPAWVIIKFSDTGPGIAPEVAERLFEPFFTTKKSGEGTGLGLSICQRLVDSYRGRINPQSVPGRGATFIISFPEETA